MRILLAVDDSTHSQCATEAVRSRPWPSGSTVRVVSVFRSALPVDPLTWTTQALGYESYAEAAKKQATATVERAAAILRQADVAVETKVEDGDTRTVIVDEAEKWNADLIVVGSHGLGRVRRLLLGSVAQYLATHAPCSIEIVRQKIQRKES